MKRLSQQFWSARLKEFFRSWTGARRSKTRILSRELRVEQLEDRVTPAVYTVVGFVDGIGVVTPTGGDNFNASTLRAAVTAANANPGTDTIVLLQGTYSLSLQGPGFGGLDITDDLIIVGQPQNAALTYIDATTLNDRIFDITGVTVTISDVTMGNASFIGGSGENMGGAIRNAGNLTLNNSVISGNTVTGLNSVGGNFNALGGGIYNSGVLTLNGSTISNNQVFGATLAVNFATAANAGQGGGIFNAGGEVYILNGSVITNNTAKGGDNEGALNATRNGGVGQGGGVYNQNGYVLVDQSSISNNQALGGSPTVNNTGASANRNGGVGHGGGIYNTAGTIDFFDSTVSGNAAIGGNSVAGTNNNGGVTGNGGEGAGGAVYITSGGNVVIETSTFDSNTATGGATPHTGTSTNDGGLGRGGAIRVASGTLSIFASSFSNNIATGGAVTNAGGDDGGEGHGGAIHNQGILTVTNSTISGNTVAGGNTIGSGGGDIGGEANGGGIRNFTGGTTILNNSTIAFNTANGGIATGGGSNGIGSGGGISTTNTSFTVFSTIVANNTTSDVDQDVGGTFTSEGFNLIGVSEQGDLNGFQDATDLVGVPGDEIDPLLGPLQNNGGPTFTHAITTASPAFNTGDNGNGLTFDQRGDGFGRVVGLVADIGAFEVQPTVTLVNTASSIREGQAADFVAVLDMESNVAVTVNLSFTGTATLNVDYTVSGNAITIPAGETFGFVTITALTDLLAEGNETVVASIITAGGAGIGSPSTSTITIENVLNLYAVGRGGGIGTTSTVKVYLPNGVLLREFTPFVDWVGGLTVATGDVDNDGTADIIVGTGPGTNAHIKVFSGATGAELFSFLPFDGFTGGIEVAAGDINNDGRADIIVGAGPGGNSHVKVFSGSDLATLQSFFAFEGWTGGVTVGAGNVDGVGGADIIVGAGVGTPPHVKVFSGTDLTLLQSFFAFDQAFIGGIYVAGGNVNLDGFADIIVGANLNGNSHVKVFDGATNSEVFSFFSYPGFTGPVRVGAIEATGNGIDDILTGAGPVGAPHVKVFSSTDLALLQSYFAFDPDFTGGIFVG